MSLLQDLAGVARPALEFPYIQRTRRNHGLEHATIHVLSRRRILLSGRSDDHGFYLLGDAPTDAIEAAAKEALTRMRGGEASLAVHPNCGTNLVTTGMMASFVALLGFGGRSRREGFDRLPLVSLLVMIAVLVSQPLGMDLQRYFTTDGVPGTLEIISITRSERTLPWGARSVIHRVETRF